jgi:cysteine desulfurase/selenocysteine lyase
MMAVKSYSMICAQKLLSDKTKLVSFTHVSNALGTVTPAHEIIKLAHRVGAKVLLDAAQYLFRIFTRDVPKHADWLSFSGIRFLHLPALGHLWQRCIA